MTEENEISEEKTETPPAALSVERARTEPPRASLQPFFEALQDFISKDDLSLSCRVVSQGVFIQLGFENRIIAAYQSWLQRETEGAVLKSEEKCIKRLFESLDPPVFYVIEGAKCLVGHLIQEKVDKPQKLSIPLFRGMALDAADYIHPKDPIIDSIPDLEVFSGRDGPSYRFKVHGRAVAVSLLNLRELRKLFADSRKLSQILPGAASSLRGTLQGVLTMLVRASPVRLDQRLIVPVRFRENKSTVLLRFGPLVLVTDQSGSLLMVYSLEGRSFDQFLKNEFNSFPRLPRSERIDGFEPDSRLSFAVGNLRISRYTYPLSVRAFREFYDQLRESPLFRGVLKGPHTIIDCLKQITPLFVFGEWEREKRSRGRAKRQRHYRLAKDWVFVTDDRGTVLSFRSKIASQGTKGGWRKNQRRRRHVRH